MIITIIHVHECNSQFFTENSTDDDWERDFDVELTEEELKAADEIAKKLNLSAADYTTIAGEMVSGNMGSY